MSNKHFYTNFQGSTFHNNFMPPMFVPPPPLPPPNLFVLPVTQAPNFDVIDLEFVKSFERYPDEENPVKSKPKPISIIQVRHKLRDIALSLNELKRQEKELAEKASNCSEDEWKDAIEKVNHNKMFITNLLSTVNSSYLDMSRKLIAKRTAKRLRLKRQRSERKRAEKDRIKELEEKSRKIDENLQKIKDSITKAKQEEDSKLQADIVLKEVLRKKHNAKKFISKLDALKKLRIARVNTAKGRGLNVPTKDCEEFEEKIDKLKSLWAQKLIVYEKEKEDLLAKLEQDSSPKGTDMNQMEKQVASSLKKWRRALFGDAMANPQADFDGDVARFVAVRSQWDQYATEAGTSLPIGWVTPTTPSQ